MLLEQFDAVEFHKITIISNEHIGQIAKHVGQSLDGEQIHYVLEEDPLGVAEALISSKAIQRELQTSRLFF